MVTATRPSAISVCALRHSRIAEATASVDVLNGQFLSYCRLRGELALINVIGTKRATPAPLCYTATGLTEISASAAVPAHLLAWRLFLQFIPVQRPLRH